MSAIAVAQCRTTEIGVLARRTVSAPRKTCTRKRTAMAAIVGVTKGERRRSRQATAISASTSGATANASKRCDHSQSVPSPSDGRRRPWQSGQSGTGQPGAVDPRPASEHQRHEGDDVGGERQAQEMLHRNHQRNRTQSPTGNYIWRGKNLRLRGGRRWVRAKRSAVKRWSALAGLALGLVLLVGCREIRVNTLAAGTTTVLGGNQIRVVRDAVALGKLGIHAPVHYKGEFGVVLLMGPHDRTGYKQIVESIRANLAARTRRCVRTGSRRRRRTVASVSHLHALDRSE